MVCFCLYVGVVVLGLPQDRLREALLFGVTLLFGVCYGVVYAFSFTCHAWRYVETAAVWMWKHVSTAFFYRNNH
jgi:hypothetical protein